MQQFKRRLKAFSALFVLFALFSVPLLAQTFRGSINGTVTDSSGAVVPGAKVTATDVSTSAGRDTVSSGAGEFLFSDLPLSTYTVKVAATGFQSTEVTGVQVQDLTICKYVDKSSPTVIQACCAGTHMPEAMLSLRKAGGTSPVEYLKIKLNEVLVSSHTFGSSGGDEVMETITLNFAQFNMEYQPQDNTGAKKGGTVTGKWHIPKNATA